MKKLKRSRTPSSSYSPRLVSCSTRIPSNRRNSLCKCRDRFLSFKFSPKSSPWNNSLRNALVIAKVTPRIITKKSKIIIMKINSQMSMTFRQTFIKYLIRRSSSTWGSEMTTNTWCKVPLSFHVVSNSKSLVLMTTTTTWKYSKVTNRKLISTKWASSMRILDLALSQ